MIPGSCFGQVMPEAERLIQTYDIAKGLVRDFKIFPHENEESRSRDARHRRVALRAIVAGLAVSLAGCAPVGYAGYGDLHDNPRGLMRGFEAILDAHLYSVSAQTLGISGMNITLGLNPGPAVRPPRILTRRCATSSAHGRAGGRQILSRGAHSRSLAYFVSRTIDREWSASERAKRI
jgi:hypothetical protein